MNTAHAPVSLDDDPNTSRSSSVFIGVHRWFHPPGPARGSFSTFQSVNGYSGGACDPTNAGASPRWVSPTLRMQRPTFPWKAPVDPLTIVKGRRMLGGIGRCRAWRRPRGGGGPWRRRRSAVGGRLRGCVSSCRCPCPAARCRGRGAIRWGSWLDAMRRHGDVFRFRLGPLLFHQVAHPDHVRRVLLDNARNYPRSSFYDRIRVVVGEGLVTTEGAPWRRLRRMSQPAFHHERIAALGGMMTEAIGAMLDRWRRACPHRRRHAARRGAGVRRADAPDRRPRPGGIDLIGEADRLTRAVTRPWSTSSIGSTTCWRSRRASRRRGTCGPAGCSVCSTT